MAEKAVLFDIENTLIKEAKDVSVYYFEAIRSSYGLSLEDISLAEYGGFTVQERMMDILKKQGLSDNEIYEKRDLFLEELPYAHYNVAGHDKAILLDGAKDLLNRLNGNNYLIGAATGQLERILKNLFDRVGLNYDHYFKFGLYGNASEHMPKILESAIAKAVDEFGAKKEYITFITSSSRNASIANSLGITGIAVLGDNYSKRDIDNDAGIKVKSLRDSERFIK